MLRTCSRRISQVKPIIFNCNQSQCCSSQSSSLQLTLAILKPDLVQHPHNLAAVHNMILDNQFLVVRSKYLHLSRSRAEQFYQEHENKFFYTRLVTYMSGGPCQPLILAKRDAIKDWRALMGPTKVFSTRYSHPDTIRGRVGLTDTRNSSHGSDSDTTAALEIGFFFPEFSIDDWNRDERYSFESGNVVFDEENFVHHRSEDSN